MNKKRYTPLFVLMIVGFLSGIITHHLITSRPAQAQSADESQKASAQRWEYCALTKAVYVGSIRGGLYWISYFRDAGVEVLEVEDTALERNGPARAIARLGAEGWELVGEGPLEIRVHGVRALYFKRPKL
jgi:hypothetical protein